MAGGQGGKQRKRNAERLELLLSVDTVWHEFWEGETGLGRPLSASETCTGVLFPLSEGKSLKIQLFPPPWILKTFIKVSTGPQAPVHPGHSLSSGGDWQAFEHLLYWNQLTP